jgi:hypothetical protein
MRREPLPTTVPAAHAPVAVQPGFAPPTALGPDGPAS